MREQKRILKLDRYEFGVVFDALNCKRNMLLSANHPTDLVDDVLLKVADAPYKNERKEAKANER